MILGLRSVATAVVVALSLTCFVAMEGQAQARTRGIVDQPAPTWQGIASWHQLPDGKSSLDVSELQGKVVYLYFFQSWCPGCHSRGFPTLAATRAAFAGRDDVAFVVVQTVFEGFGSNTAHKGLEAMKKFGLDIPMGHDPGPEGAGSRLMRRYRSGGTPWTVLIDKKGVVRFNGFHITPAAARSKVQALLGPSTTVR